MKRKRVMTCLICGLRVGAARSAFCRVDAKRLGVDVIKGFRLSRMHLFQWSWQMTGWYGKSVSEMLKDEWTKI